MNSTIKFNPVKPQGKLLPGILSLGSWLLILAFLSASMLSGCGGGGAPEGADIQINTDQGDIFIDLYDDTPLHKANFIKLAKSGFYDGITWHRVMKDFMIQTGDPSTAKGKEGGPQDAGYTLPQEIKPNHYHIRGALSAARKPDQVNPNWESSGSQFYIVQGKKISDGELNNTAQGVNSQTLQPIASRAFYDKPENQWMRSFDKVKMLQTHPDSANMMQAKIDAAWQEHIKGFNLLSWPPEIRDKYKNEGGTPFLDYTYTVFGQVISGMDVVDKIAAVPVSGPGSVPVEDVRIITVKVLE